MRQPNRIKVRVRSTKIKLKIKLGGQIVIQESLEIPESYPDLIKFWMKNGV